MLAYAAAPVVVVAVTVMTFDPAKSGMFADQDVVPVATPDDPRELLHRTTAIPAGADAVPVSVTEGLLKFVDGGDVIAICGAVFATSVRTMVITFETVAFSESVAVTVSTFGPITSGIPATLQFGTPVAVPDAPLSVRHVTTVCPNPPDTVPLMLMRDAAVLAGGTAFNVSAKGCIGEPGPGAAYNC